jgi:hypothetical protein
MTKHVDMILTGVQALTVRSLAGAGKQVELLIRTKQGDLSIRLVDHRGNGIRLIDLRQRDRKNRKQEKGLVQVPFGPLVAGGKE